MCNKVDFITEEIPLRFFEITRTKKKIIKERKEKRVILRFLPESNFITGRNNNLTDG
jgi:hypothetical protein